MSLPNSVMLYSGIKSSPYTCSFIFSPPYHHCPQSLSSKACSLLLFLPNVCLSVSSFQDLARFFTHGLPAIWEAINKDKLSPCFSCTAAGVFVPCHAQALLKLFSLPRSSQLAPPPLPNSLFSSPGNGWEWWWELVSVHWCPSWLLHCCCFGWTVVIGHLRW